MIGLPNSDVIYSVISGWNHEVIVFYGEQFSCSFQNSPYFYFWHNSKWSYSLKSTQVIIKIMIENEQLIFAVTLVKSCSTTKSQESLGTLN